MDKFQIVEVSEQFNHAGTKATADIAVIAEKLGFQKVLLQMRTAKEGYCAKIRRQIGYFQDWNKSYRTISKGALVLLQHPFHYPQLTREKILYKLKNEKKVKFISVIHDVEELRAFRFTEYYKREFDVMIDIADVMIVHNEAMKNFFIERGVEESKLINLDVFDYLQKNTKVKAVTFEKSIAVAGNLDTSKCQYIGQLGELNGIKVNLYGPNFDKKMKLYDNVVYHGSFSVDEISDQLIAGFGLVWDGESIDGCRGLSGQYLRFNNPHKLSLYLSSGMPVVIWSEAAEAEFVRKHGVGICVDKLTELDGIFGRMSVDEYRTLCARVQRLSTRLCVGDFTYKAIQSCIERISS